MFPHLTCGTTSRTGSPHRPGRARSARGRPAGDGGPRGPRGASAHQCREAWHSASPCVARWRPAQRWVLLDEPFGSLDRAPARPSGTRSGSCSERRTECRHGDPRPGRGVVDGGPGRRDARRPHVQVGAPDEVHDRPVTPWVATFLGHAAWCPCRARRPRRDKPLGTVRAERVVSGATRLLVRPEHLSLMAPGEGACDAVVEARRFEGSAVMLVLQAVTSRGCGRPALRTSGRCASGPRGPAAAGRAATLAFGGA